METYHPRRSDRDMPGRDQQLALLRRQRVAMLAMCDANEPYMVMMDHALSEADNCLYVHCAADGRKVEVLRRNPRIWGMVVEDGGYVQGECTHAYRSVMFQAKVSFVEDEHEKRRALCLMIDQFEPDPAPLREKLLAGGDWASKVLVLRLDIQAMSGKQNERPTSLKT